MTKLFYVLDGENSTLWHGREHNDGPQVFKSFAAAARRARAAAETEPGKLYKIVGVEAVVACDVSKAKIHGVR